MNLLRARIASFIAPMVQANSLFSLSGLISFRPSANPPNSQLASSRNRHLTKKPTKICRLFLERVTRLELAISSLGRKHSTTELHPHIFSNLSLTWKYLFVKMFILNRVFFFFIKLIKRSLRWDFSLLAEDETRTRNNLLGRQALYHWVTSATLSF